MSEIDVRKLYLCNYGENALDLPVVDYNDYEELYKQLQQLKAENEGLQSLNDFNVQKIETLESENEELRKEKDKYYQMTLDDEIQLNNLYQELQKESDLGHKAICEEMDSFFEVMKLQEVLDEIFENIEYIEATAERIDDDNYIALACCIAETSRNILQLIKQAKEGE